MSTDCPRSCDAAAWLADELDPDPSLSFQQHLACCPQCRKTVESHRQILQRLQTVPPAAVSRDLSSAILARVRAESIPPPSQSHHRVALAIAAMLLLFIGGGLWLRLNPNTPRTGTTASRSPETQSVDRALDWFCDNQETDGSWDAVKWGGDSRFEVALTALPLVALLERRDTPRRHEAITRAVAYVRRQQRADGTFGENFRETPYVQSVCTLALLQAYQRSPQPELRPAIDAALAVVVATQTGDGGWGYHHSPAPSLPITLWHKEVLEVAVSLGWESAKGSLVRVQHWLAAQPNLDAVGSDFLEAGGTDYHRAYFATAMLRHQKTAEARQQLSTIRHILISHQAAEGKDAGTWNPTDQWSRAGGRIYSTALASLALE